MRLLIMQHGEAMPAQENPDRPLTERGRKDVEGVARTLASAGIQVQQVYHSGKTRARESAGILAARVGAAEASAATEGIGAKDNPLAFVDRVEALPAGTAIVSHLPFVARLVSVILSGNDEPQLVEFVPGTVACLERGEEGGWRIAWMLRPELAG